MVNIGFFRPNTYVLDYQIQVDFFLAQINMCGMSPLGIISTFFLLVWLENIFYLV